MISSCEYNAILILAVHKLVITVEKTLFKVKNKISLKFTIIFTNKKKQTTFSHQGLVVQRVDKICWLSNQN